MVGQLLCQLIRHFQGITATLWQGVRKHEIFFPQHLLVRPSPGAGGNPVFVYISHVHPLTPLQLLPTVQSLAVKLTGDTKRPVRGNVSGSILPRAGSNVGPLSYHHV